MVFTKEQRKKMLENKHQITRTQKRKIKYGMVVYQLNDSTLVCENETSCIEKMLNMILHYMRDDDFELNSLSVQEIREILETKKYGGFDECMMYEYGFEFIEPENTIEIRAKLKVDDYHYNSSPDFESWKRKDE